MSDVWRLRFAPNVPRDARAAAADALAAGLDDAHRFPGYRRSVKDFFVLDSPAGPLFVKVRRYRSWLRRLARTLRATKEDVELRNLERLRELGVPCPRPVAAGRKSRRGLIEQSLIAVEYLADAAPLSRLLGPDFPGDPEAARGTLS